MIKLNNYNGCVIIYKPVKHEIRYDKKLKEYNKCCIMKKETLIL